MNKHVFIFCVLMVLIKISSAQNLIISSIKVGELKLEMPLDSVNKYIDKKVALKKFTIAESISYDTVTVLYKTIPLLLDFRQEYDDKDKELYTSLCSIYCDDKIIKTKSGFKIGDNKYDIIKKLEGSYLAISPDKEKGKNYSTVALIDYSSNCQLVFCFKDNILYALQCKLSEEGYD